MSPIEDLTAREILDSRGRPTVYATCRLGSGAIASVSVPSGASTGQAESHELRDGDPKRYRGLGCRQAVANVNGEIARAMVGRHFEGQAAFDHALIDLDGTPNKARLGSNAVLAVSIAFARAVAREHQVPLYVYFASLLGEEAQFPSPPDHQSPEWRKTCGRASGDPGCADCSHFFNLYRRIPGHGL